ncbi:K(+)-transporting ATPase subunit F [Calothrix sp. PCC 6303]|uniref:K(+)-transporting ATPase subunit F n=1 Tax=Calothrix sp. PCC 6303 TaxID=1170562 RepID=UPI0002A0245E|nr:K(+)-transporting ATPase subunit F [Calothrix sp. PCC 6303]AFY99774.1 K+-transporting ATPase, F subunit [Calothrix sp. PCC 6303]
MKDLAFLEVFVLIGSKRNRVPLSLFLVMCLSVLLSPAVQAATPGDTSRWQVYTIGLLGLVTVCLCVYLFVVIFQPERF